MSKSIFASGLDDSGGNNICDTIVDNFVVPFMYYCLLSSLLLNDVERCALRHKRVKHDILKIITEILVWE